MQNPHRKNANLFSAILNSQICFLLKNIKAQI